MNFKIAFVWEIHISGVNAFKFKILVALAGAIETRNNFNYQESSRQSQSLPTSRDTPS